MIAVCPDGHGHVVVEDGAGFAVYGFFTYMGMPCRWNRFRIKQK
jgi:hypothetical protein